MVRRLEIKKVHAPSYSTLKKETENFQKPIVLTLNENDISRIQKVRDVLLDFEENNKKDIFNNSDNLTKLNDVTQYSRGEDSRGSKDYSTSLLFLTKDKIISPIEFSCDKYISTVDSIIETFFNTSCFQEKFKDSSFFQKIFLFACLKKGIFGKFKPENLSNFTNLNTWYSHGNTNTFIHTDNGLCNFFIQLTGAKRWWLASHFHKKEILQELFISDITKLDFNNSFFNELEYYDFELKQEEVLFFPANWLHGVVAPPGVNLSLSFLFPMTIKELIRNVLYWKSLGVPLNHSKKSTKKNDKTMAEVNTEQAEVFNQLKFYFREHKFSTRKIQDEELDVISGLYDINKIGEAVTGAE